VYETLEGWSVPLGGVSSLEDLPPAARRYVAFVEEQLDVEVSLVGTGAEREAVLASRGVAAVARP
jgi:adenylosuccinate synthase